MNKPITLIREEFIKNITDTINSSGLPPFVLSPIFESIFREIKNAELHQLELDRDKYEKEIKNEESNENKI